MNHVESGRQEHSRSAPEHGASPRQQEGPRHRLPRCQWHDPAAGLGVGEVAPAGVHKGAAIEAILAHLGIDAADAIGIGDNWNDAEMFEVCGTAIAMGNAVEGVQALADQVTTAIDDDGIHNAFVRNGLI